MYLCSSVPVTCHSCHVQGRLQGSVSLEPQCWKRPPDGQVVSLKTTIHDATVAVGMDLSMCPDVKLPASGNLMPWAPFLTGDISAVYVFRWSQARHTYTRL